MRAGALLLALALLLLCGCAAAPRGAATAPAVTEPAATEPPAPVSEEPPAAEKEETAEMKLQIGETPVTVRWEENASVTALRDLVRQGELRLELSGYGGFEQVGPIGQSLPRDDVQTTTAAGDIVLYAGNQLVIFYGSNSWAYTRLGHITEPDAAGLTELLSQDSVRVSLSLDKSES